MDPRPENPTTPEPSSEEQPAGFWQRVFGGGKEDGSEPEPESEAAPPAPPLAQAKPIHNKPRKRAKTIFDQAQVEQKRRNKKAALIRRDRLTQAIGEKVERVIDERMELSEEKLADVAGVFDDMNVLLGAIGRNLDEQGKRAERVAHTIEQLPAHAAQEQAVLETIANKLQHQAESVNGVPEVVSLVRHGSQVAEQRLMVLQGLKQELEVQRDQREQVLITLRESAQRFDERMSSLEESIAKGQIESRSDARRLRQAVETNTEAMREESRKDTVRNDEVVDHLRQVSVRLGEGNSLASLATRTQGKSIAAFQDAHQDMLDLLVRTNNQTVSEMHRLQEETRDREEELARRNRLTLVGSTGFLAIMAAALIGWLAPQQRTADVSPVIVPVTAPTAPAAREKKKSKTLPASMPRTEAGGR